MNDEKKPAMPVPLAYCMLMLGIGVVFGPWLKLAYLGRLSPGLTVVAVLIACLAGFGAAGALVITTSELFYILIKRWEQKLVKAGWTAHWSWGFGLGIALMVTGLYGGIAITVGTGLPLGLKIPAGIGGLIMLSFGWALLYLHNIMARAKEGRTLLDF